MIKFSKKQNITEQYMGINIKITAEFSSENVYYKNRESSTSLKWIKKKATDFQY